MSDNIKIYNRNLPHIHPPFGIFFITFRLVDSLPKAVLLRLLEERKMRLKMLDTRLSKVSYEEKKYKIEKRFFAAYDKWLDDCKHGTKWLLNQHIASEIAQKIHELDDNKYNLITYCIMPNHVHLLIETTTCPPKINLKRTTKNYPLADVMRLLKGSTSRKCNQILGRSGTFWHHESFDHFVRDEGEFYRIIKYILLNPVKAGLVNDSREWEFSYINDKFTS